MDQVTFAVVRLLDRVTYFKLTKLLYLIDLEALNRLGRTLTDSTYLRQPDGPWPPALRDRLKLMDGHEVVWSFSRRIPLVGLGPSPRFSVDLDDSALSIAAEVVERYVHVSNARMKSAVYLTQPMRYILREERKGRDMRRVPIIHKDKTCCERD